MQRRRRGSRGEGRAGAARRSVEEWEDELQRNPANKQDMNALVINYFVTEGYVEAAEQFQQESGTAPGVDLATITDRMVIRQAVQGGQIEEAIDKVNDLNPEILEHQRELYFHLQQQRLIELIKLGDADGALTFAQEYLAPYGEESPEFLGELERTVALLAFDRPGESPFADLFSPSHRNATASELNAALLASQCQEKEPRLPRLLKMLVWAQQRLDAEQVGYPRIDLRTGQLSPNPALAAQPASGGGGGPGGEDTD